MNIQHMPVSSSKPTRHSAQWGGVLVFGLVLLLILTILGAAGTQVSNMELRMSSNALDKSISFQEAEDGRVAAELAAITAADGLNATPVVAFDCNRPGHFSKSATANTSGCTGLATDLVTGGDIRNLDWSTDSITADNNSDRYIIEYLGIQQWIAPTDDNRGTNLQTSLSAHTFRLTVRGLGVDGGFTYVRAVYSRLVAS